MCLITTLLYPLRIDCHLESVIYVPKLYRPWHRWLFKILVDCHQVDGKYHLLVDVLSKHLRHRFELSLIGALDRRLVDMTFQFLCCALEGNSCVDRKRFI